MQQELTWFPLQKRIYFRFPYGHESSPDCLWRRAPFKKKATFKLFFGLQHYQGSFPNTPLSVSRRKKRKKLSHGFPWILKKQCTFLVGNILFKSPSIAIYIYNPWIDYSGNLHNKYHRLPFNNLLHQLYLQVSPGCCILLAFYFLEVKASLQNASDSNQVSD